MFLVALRKYAPAALAALWAAPFIHYGGTKRAVPDRTDAVCAAGGGIDGVASVAAASPEPTTTAGGRFRVAVRPATNGLARPADAALFDRWRRRGAADDAFRLAPPGWWFRLPDGFSDGVTVFSRGEIRPAARTPYFPPVFAGRVSLLPQARWHMLGGGAAESGLWRCLTPSNTLLVGWTNAAPGRDPSTPTNAVAELFRDGRFAYRYADHAVEYAPVLPFDWDGDGLENSVDPDPRVAGPDAHGTDAAWCLAVCSNVFAAAETSRPLPYTSLQTRVGVGDGVAAAPPPGVAWREGVNTNAYYFVDVVAERGPAPVYFQSDRESRLGSPVVVALAEATNRVPLLVGVKYAVTSEVPFSVSVPAAGNRSLAMREVFVTTHSPTSCEIEWPVRFEFKSIGNETDTFSVGVSPDGLDGTFTWGGESVVAVAVRTLFTLRGLAEGCGCYSGFGNVVSFHCGGCCCDGGCPAFGTYVYEGGEFSFSGGSCGCTDGGEDGGGDYGGDGDPTKPSSPSVSVSFSPKVVLLEEACETTPGVSCAKRSTRTTLVVQIAGNVHGGTLTLSTRNVDRLKGAEELDGMSVAVSVGEQYSREYVLEGDAASSSERDVEVSGTFVENMTGHVARSGTAAATVVEVALEADVAALGNPCAHRRRYGVGEDVWCVQRPASPEVGWRSDGGGTFRVDGGDRVFECPLRADSGGLSAEYAGASLHFDLEVVEPDAVVCDYAAFLGDSQDGLGAGMLLRIQFSPFSVSFANLEMQEIPADLGNWPQWGAHSGYFDDMAYYDRWCHTTAWGAGTWHGVDELNAMGFDRSRIWTWAKPWSNGRLSWKIPYGWRRKNSDTAVCAGEIHPPSYSVWSMSPDFLEKTKHGHRVGQSASGEIFFDGVLQYENGQE